VNQSESHISVRIRFKLVGSVPFVPVGYFYSYVIGDGTCKYNESTKESYVGLIPFKIILYI
jgi:hypothetical protein